MVTQLLLFASMLVSGTMVGNEMAVSVFVHPQIARLDDPPRAQSRQLFARVFGQVMPFWYALTIVLSVAVTYVLHRTLPGNAYTLSLASSALWIAALIFTLVGPVRINNQITQWNLDALPADWQAQEQKWDRLHAVRVVILLLAFACLLLAGLAVH